RQRIIGIVTARIEIRHVVSLRVSWPKVVITRAVFEAQSRRNLPAISDVRLVLIEAEEPNRIVVSLVIRSEISQERIGKRIEGSIWVGTAAVECQISRVDGAAVLILAIAHNVNAHLDRVLAGDQGKVIAR